MLIFKLSYSLTSEMANGQMYASVFDNPIDIVSINETWLTNVKESYYAKMLPGYKFLSK